MASRAIEDHNLEEAVTRLPRRSASKSATETKQAQPGRKLSRTFRSGLSAFVSTSTTLCQVPSAGRPLRTGSVSEGDTNAGST